MRLLSLELHTRFRGLPPGFKIDFRKETSFGKKIEPLCFVGLNGSGKSNLLQVLGEIFYYLETYLSDTSSSEKKYKTSFGFTIKYRLDETTWKLLFADLGNDADKLWHEREMPVIKVEKNPNKLSDFSIQLESSESIDEKYHKQNEEVFVSIAGDKKKFLNYLPRRIVAYSSGMNELISNPFIKININYFEEFQKRLGESVEGGTLNVNRLFFMDYESNKMVLLANYLFNWNNVNHEKKLKLLNDLVQTSGLKKFSISIHLRDTNDNPISIPSELNLAIESLKKCATAYDDNENDHQVSIQKLENDLTSSKKYYQDLENRLSNQKNEESHEIIKELNQFLNLEQEKMKSIEQKINKLKLLFIRRLRMDYFVDIATMKAFRYHFKTPFELYRVLYLLNILNVYTYGKRLRTNIKDAGIGVNLSNLVPKYNYERLLFYIDEITLDKKEAENKVFYRQLSDGEHQLLHIIGTVMLMDTPGTLFILDEPETHFNPEWRSKLISLLNKITSFEPEQRQQEFLLTSHSPFIVSDCKPEHVFIFEKTGKKDGVKYSQPDFNTFGASVNQISSKVFGKKETIAGLANQRIKEIRDKYFNKKLTRVEAMNELETLGDSVEKLILIDEINSRRKR